MQKSKTFNGKRVRNIQYTGDWADYLRSKLKNQKFAADFSLFDVKYYSDVETILKETKNEYEKMCGDNNRYHDQKIWERKLRGQLIQVELFLNNAFPYNRGKKDSLRLVNEIINSTHESQQLDYLKGLIESLEVKFESLKGEYYIKNGYKY